MGEKVKVEIMFPKQISKRKIAPRNLQKCRIPESKLALFKLLKLLVHIYLYKKHC